MIEGYLLHGRQEAEKKYRKRPEQNTAPKLGPTSYF
jgi:hypothetical protein